MEELVSREGVSDGQTVVSLQSLPRHNFKGDLVTIV